VWTPKTKSLLPSLYKRSRLSRDLAKRGEGRFSEEYIFSIMDSLVTIEQPLLSGWFTHTKSYKAYSQRIIPSQLLKLLSDSLGRCLKQIKGNANFFMDDS
jgi:preprotein translocase subunit Sec63